MAFDTWGLHQKQLRSHNVLCMIQLDDLITTGSIETTDEEV